MLVIIRRLSAMMRRPKYHRTLTWPQWVVWDTEEKKRVHGPTTHMSCIRYMKEHDEARNCLCDAGPRKIPV